MSSHCYNKNLPLAGRDASLLLENGITVDVSTHTLRDVTISVHIAAI